VGERQVDGPPPAGLDVLLGVSGGIAAYRAAELCRLLVRRGLGVVVCMTPQARRFVGATTFAGLSRRPVLLDAAEPGGAIYPHLDAARAARVLCIAPCSANTLAKLAHGLADNVLTESALAATSGHLDLVLAVRAIDDTVPDSLRGETWTVSVYGADKPGIVHEVTQLLADVGANVVDLTTRVIGQDDRPLYAMLLDVTLPAGVEGDALRARLDGLAAELGVDCSMHPADADVL